MPSNILSADTLFPAYDRGVDTQEYLEEVSDYLFLLKEQLGYSLHNLGVANFNAMQLDVLAETIRKPLYAQIQDTDDNVASLQLTAAGLISRMDNFGGASSTIEQTVGGISSTVSSLSSSVGTINSNYVSKTTATQTSSGFKLDVRSGTNAVMATLDKDGLTIRNGAIKIKNNYGADVMYADQNGNIFMTGTIKGANIYGGFFATGVYIYDEYGILQEPMEPHIRISGNRLVSRKDRQNYGIELFVGEVGVPNNIPQLNLYRAGINLLQLTTDGFALQSYIYAPHSLSILCDETFRIGEPNRPVSVNIYGALYVNGNFVAG